MAHRTDVTQVPSGFPMRSEAEAAKEVHFDPCCGRKLGGKEVRHVLFLADETFHFCSKECLEKFRASRYSPKAA